MEYTVIRSMEFESHYGLLKQLGLENYVEKASKLSRRELQCLSLLLCGIPVVLDVHQLEVVQVFDE